MNDFDFSLSDPVHNLLGKVIANIAEFTIIHIWASVCDDMIISFGNQHFERRKRIFVFTFYLNKLSSQVTLS